jgi:hydroxymethylbilane synthase
LQIEIITVTTSGDKGNREQLGAFVKEIQESLLRNEIDIALHCLKDLPTTVLDGTCLAAHLERDDPRDTMITNGHLWHDLPSGAVVGTGSLRRTAQLKALGKDWSYERLVGNVDTRLKKLREGQYDAIVLALASIDRLKAAGAWQADDFRVEALPFDTMLPAAGQGVLVLECRSSDTETIEWVAALDHSPTRMCAIAERSFLGSFGTGCSLPIGAFAECRGDVIDLQGVVASPDGKTVLRESITGTDPKEIAAELSDRMRSQGAAELLGMVK